MKSYIRKISAVIFVGIFSFLFGITVLAQSIPETITAPINPFGTTTIPTESTTIAETITQPTTATTTEPPTTTAIPTTTSPPISALIPDNVREINENGVKKIVKTYELSGKENPDYISRDSFELNGWEYAFAEIIKKETVDAKTREYTQTVALTPDTTNVQVIKGVLEKAIQYTSGDGYSGTLTLDENSVKAQVSGTKNVAYTISKIREYPNLSYNDTSFIPKSISDKSGRVLALSKVTWHTYSAAFIDYDTLPESYTGIATYMATAYKTVITGYTGSAEYTGTISKSTPSKTIYTVTFTGTEIPPPTTTELPTTTEPPTTTEVPTTELIVIEEPETFNPVPVAVATSTGSAGLLVGFVFFFFWRKNVRVFNKIGDNVELIGKTRVNDRLPIINLTPFASMAQNSHFTLVFGRFTAWRLRDKTISINYHDKQLQHIVNYDGGEYQFEVSF